MACQHFAVIILISISIHMKPCLGDATITFDLYKSSECKLNHFIVIVKEAFATNELAYFPAFAPMDTYGIKYRATVKTANNSIKGATNLIEFEWFYGEQGSGGCCWSIEKVKVQINLINPVEVEIYSTDSVVYQNCFTELEDTPEVTIRSNDVSKPNFSFKSLCQYKLNGIMLESVKSSCVDDNLQYSEAFYSLSTSVVNSVSPTISTVSNMNSIISISIQPSSTQTPSPASSATPDQYSSSTTAAFNQYSSRSSIFVFPEPTPTAPVQCQTNCTTSTSIIQYSTSLLRPTNNQDNNQEPDFTAAVEEFESLINNLTSQNIVNISTLFVKNTINEAKSIISKISDSQPNAAQSAISQMLVSLDDLGQIGMNEIAVVRDDGNTSTQVLMARVTITSPTTSIEYPDSNSISITLPESSLNTTDTHSIVSYYYNNLSSLLKPNNSSLSIESPVLSALIYCSSSGFNETASSSLTPLVEEVIITFNLKGFKSATADDEDLSCVSVELSSNSPFNGEWNDNGCSLERVQRDTQGDDPIAICNCSHLTHFAILLSPRTDIPAKDSKILTVIGLVLVPISMVCMIAVIVVYVMMKSLWNMRVYVHIMLCASLFMSQLLFITGIDKTSNKDLCSGIAIVLEYLFLVTFMWMLMEGVVLFISLTQVFIDYTKYYLIAFTAASYGIPAIYMIVVIPIGMLVNVNDLDGNGTHFVYQSNGVTACWLNYETHFIWTFISPVIVIILVNICFFIMTVIILRKHEKKLDKKNTVRRWLKVAVSLTTVMGITWLGGVLAFSRHLIFVAYIMTILIASQGLIIFFLFVPLSKQVRTVYAAQLRKYFPENYILNSTKLFTFSSRVSTNSKKNGTAGSNSSKTAVNGIVLGTFTIEFNDDDDNDRQSLPSIH